MAARNFSGLLNLLCMMGLLVTPAMAQQPAEITAFRNELFQECRSLGGSRPTTGANFVREVNLSPDGTSDYIVDAQWINCPGAQTFTCGTAGCPIRVYVSQGGVYRLAFNDYSRGMEIRRREGGDLIINDGRPMSWNGTRLVFGAGSQPGAPPPQPGVRAAAWQVINQNGRERAQGAGAGVIRDAMLLCDAQNRPRMTLGLPQGTPARVPVVFELGALRMTVAFTRTFNDLLFWDADPSAMQTLANLFGGQAQQIAVTIGNQMPGILRLDGASVAVRRAMASCHRFPTG